MPISYVFHCWLNLHFSDYKWEETSFHMLISNLNVFFCELLILFLCPFSIKFICFLLTTYWSFLYIRDINICLSFVLQIFYHLFFDFIFLVFCHINLLNVLKYIYFSFPFSHCSLISFIYPLMMEVFSYFFFLTCISVNVMFKERT